MHKSVRISLVLPVRVLEGEEVSVPLRNKTVLEVIVVVVGEDLVSLLYIFQGLHAHVIAKPRTRVCYIPYY